MKLRDSSKLWILMLAAFMDMMGLLMVLPILPFYVKSLGHGGLVVGVLVSAFAAAQLITAPLWGKFSDTYGRRPALLAGFTASAIAYLIFAFALDFGGAALAMLFLSRIVHGAGGGTVSVVQAYVADSTEPDERAKALGWLSAATNAGVAIGPVLGSLTAAAWGPRGPGLFAAAVCVVNIAFAARYLVESRDMDEAALQKAGTVERTPLRVAVLQVVTHSGEPASRLIWIYAIAMGAFQGVTSMLALYLANRFAVTEKTIGYFFAYMGGLSVLTRTLLLGRMVDKFGEARLSRIGSMLLAVGIASFAFIRPVAFMPYLPLALAVALLPLGTAFTFPCVTALLSRVISRHERGLYMGVQQTFGGLARVTFPIVFGVLFDWRLEAPFLLSATLVLATIYLGRGMESITPAAAN